MAGRISGITIEIGGDTTKLQTALKGVDSQLKSTKNNLKDIEKLLKLNPGNVELLTQKQKNLEQAIQQTKDRLQQLKDAQSQVAEGSAEWDALQREIIATEQDLKNLEKQYRQFGSVAAQQIAAVGEKMKELGEKMTDVGRKLSTRVTAPIAAAFTAAAKSASDYEENLNKIDVAFGKSAQAVKDWSATTGEKFGLSKVAATEAVAGFGALAKGIGLSEGTAAKMSMTLTGLSADLASYFNTSTEDSAAALEGIFTGQSKALTKFGVVMNETNLKAFAKDMGYVWSEMSEGEKTLLRYNFVLAKTKDAQGDYSRTSSGTANSFKTFKAAIQDLATTLGTQLLPIITPIIQKITEIINKLASLPPETQKIIVIIGLIVAAVGPLLMIIGQIATGIGALMTLAPALVAAFTFLISPIGLIIAAIAALIAVGVLLYQNWDTIKEKAIEVWNKIVDGWNAFKENLSNAFHTFGENARQSFSNTWNAVKDTAISAWDSIKNAISDKANAIKNAISSAFDAARSKVQSVVDRIRGIINGANWRLPHLAIPHLSVWGSFSINPPSVPHFSIAWYKKAYDNPMLFTSPTVLQTPQGLKGFGDKAGGEVVLGMNKLKELVGAAGDDITINVYASEGMSVNQLADAIQQRLVQLSRQKEAAYA